ncbi:hypothetical protein [Actinoallomurus iriomotensis]|uniref:Uncharacterized protein n=1 Tax=Actinoallomurus iriomotensis TaxID=478107 RepID=A0A9W6RIV1_9ACTN|nr:hypothetical protein [Actinoallomurus iriomotensis]GLY76533.1 hypothetical protein Airi01_048000 [Actinoallomurus iriomotensis]GLY91315.1 hypothetical protein Airi02_092440 [Actinoallomurus iriomotensis]
MVGFLILQAFLGIVVLGVFALILPGFVEAIRDRKPGTAFGSLVIMLAIAGIGWGIFTVASRYKEIVPTRVDRARAVNCTADILRARDSRSRLNGDSVYRFHVRVSTPGKAPYETDSTAAVSPLVAGGIGAGRTGYACRADRDHPKKVEILWDHPMP